jgi:hypothetical protein
MLLGFSILWWCSLHWEGMVVDVTWCGYFSGRWARAEVLLVARHCLACRHTSTFSHKLQRARLASRLSLEGAIGVAQAKMMSSQNDEDPFLQVQA